MRQCEKRTVDVLRTELRSVELLHPNTRHPDNSSQQGAEIRRPQAAFTRSRSATPNAPIKTNMQEQMRALGLQRAPWRSSDAICSPSLQRKAGCRNQKAYVSSVYTAHGLHRDFVHRIYSCKQLQYFVIRFFIFTLTPDILLL